MGSNTDYTPLVVILGHTASGKTSLALRLAELFNGEIICADSRTVYKGMDIGTAKPTPEERRRVPHHLLDIISPDHPISVADFKAQAVETISKIHAKGKLPFLVGGSGLYINAVIFDFSFRGKSKPEVRQALRDLSVSDLQQRVFDLGFALPENSQNPRHLARIIETGSITAVNNKLRPNTLIIGMEIDKNELGTKLAVRLDGMLQAGLEQEAKRLSDTYGWGCKTLQTIGYQEFEPYFNGDVSLDQVRQAILLHSLQYAKRQKTWFKRNKHIRYIYKLDEAVDLLTTFLNKKI